jgi:cell division protein ZapA
MAQVTLSIGGHGYSVACRDGEEAHLLGLGAVVDRKAQDAAAAVGGASEVRQLLFAALMLADELGEKNGNAAQTADTATPDQALALAAVADQLEALASKLEHQRD